MDFASNIRNKSSPGRNYNGILDSMPGGYRYVPLLAFGWLILAASPAENSARPDNARIQIERTRSLHRLASALEKLPTPPSPDGGCKQGQEIRHSELCAQWKAADAAQASADWTPPAFLLSVISSILGAFTLMAAYFAAFYAKKTWSETKRSADAADDANRPWLAISLEIVGDIKFTERGLHFDCYIILKNVGRSPALNIRLQIETFNEFDRQNDKDRMEFEIKTTAAAEIEKPVGFVMSPSEETRHYRGFTLLRERFGQGIGQSHILPLVLISATYCRDGDPIVKQTVKGFIVERLSISIGEKISIDQQNFAQAGSGFVVDSQPCNSKQIRLRHANIGHST